MTLVGTREISTATLHLPESNQVITRVMSDRVPRALLDLIEEETARGLIDAKAAALGGLPGAPLGDLRPAGGGYVRSYQGCDIYHSAATGTHEVHGDIRAKYNAVNGPITLGLPTTDETGTPDGIGRFNHFVRGSIYWTPDTGPMVVRDAIRQHWANQGWELGPLGYPVADDHQFVSMTPATDPQIHWSLFQNGAIVHTPDGVADAFMATLTPEQLRHVIRSKFDEEIHKSPDNIGLHPGVETIAISGWGYGFWASRAPAITFRLHGFHDNGLAPDTDFDMDVRLRFWLESELSFTEPAWKTLVVGLEWISVTASGLSSGSVANGVKNGVLDAFKDPMRILDIPTGANPTNPYIDFIGLQVGGDGSLGFLVNPLPDIVGKLRRLFAQQKIDAFAS
jgi:hypothetical protein